MKNVSRWRATGRSVRGASHVRADLLNQDAIQWFPESGLGPPLIVTVSDGHGSPRNFRSDVGARIAVEETTKLIRELLLEGQPDPDKLSAIKRTAQERLPGELTRRWRQTVACHLADSPITPEELVLLEQRRDAKARRSIERDPHLAYGATLLSVLVAESFVLYLQLGDGDILAVSENGEVTRPMPRDARLIANETTSLCMPEAWQEVRISFQALYGPHPALITLSTDGYANSFVNDAAFCKVGSDILDILHTDGVETVENNLSAWLADASAAGSGDDITMGILFPMDILPKETHAIADTPAGQAIQPEQEAESTAPVVIVEKLTAPAMESELDGPPPEEKPATVRHSSRSKIELIKNEESPHEPSKKLPNIFYDD
jgi:hypothetical protein